MRGLHLFPNVNDLNVSSNSILTMSGLESLNRLESLNMSCNKLTRIFCLANIAKTLKHLNLSHNRIVSLLPLEEFADISALEVLDLTDNYVGDLSHLKALAKYGQLRELSFRKAGDESKGSNPICDFVNYQDSVKLYLPNLAFLDGVMGWAAWQLPLRLLAGRSRAKAMMCMISGLPVGRPLQPDM